MRLAKIIVACLAILTTSAATAQTRTPCGDRETLLEHLATEWNEQVVAMALDANGRMVEFAASLNGTWTMLVTPAGRPTCLMASGTGWEMMLAIPRGSGA